MQPFDIFFIKQSIFSDIFEIWIIVSCMTYLTRLCEFRTVIVWKYRLLNANRASSIKGCYRIFYQSYRFFSTTKARRMKNQKNINKKSESFREKQKIQHRKQCSQYNGNIIRRLQYFQATFSQRAFWILNYFFRLYYLKKLGLLVFIIC